ncbi:MAG: helix-turn-helix domain-containing protein [Limisphaerales bacterium]
MPRLTQKAIAARWNCSVRTVTRILRSFKARPVAFDGLQPLYELRDVNSVDTKRNKQRAKMLGLSMKGGAR